MTRPDERPDIDVPDVGREGAGGEPAVADAATEAEIADLLGDTTMPIEERRARLEALAAELGQRPEADPGGEISPLEVQISEALSFLAGGGHAYGAAEADHMDADLGGAARRPGEVGPRE